MSLSKPLAKIGLMLGLLALPAMAHAQSTGEKEKPTLSDQYEIAFIKQAIEFWTPRLNQYKIEVDRMLSASDLLDVNELRTRAALLVERIQTMERKRKQRRESDYESDYAMDSTATMVDTTAYTTTSTTESETGYEADTARALTAEEARLQQEEYERNRRDWERQEEEERMQQARTLQLIHSGNEEAIASLSRERDEQPRYNHYSESHQIQEEMNQIRYVTTWVGRNYRPQMEELVGKVFEDMKEFFEVARIHSRDFAAANQTAIMQDSRAVSRMLGTLRSLKEAQGFRNMEGEEAQMAREALEIILMLYNGQDIREIMMIDGLEVASNTVIENLPAGNGLGQNMPNPASTRTIIPYTLSEPGSQVVIQLLDTRGTVVATFDQGSREAGEHSATIDIATLTPGTYLYQLKVTTAGGERLSSKGMQVVR
jgi:hypothetical protein